MKNRLGIFSPNRSSIIVLRLSEKVTMNSFKQKLIDLDNSSLTIANDFDVDFILDELDQVAKQIKQISDF
ncbi:hypothetical protein MHK_010648 [Candidatus Magnetomorum sp. HK-1]|nr:hypothetical protein MHK_010648 [Candidatus Magnetomorum sp. HK-1]